MSQVDDLTRLTLLVFNSLILLILCLQMTSEPGYSQGMFSFDYKVCLSSLFDRISILHIDSVTLLSLFVHTCEKCGMSNPCVVPKLLPNVCEAESIIYQVFVINFIPSFYRKFVRSNELYVIVNHKLSRCHRVIFELNLLNMCIITVALARALYQSLLQNSQLVRHGRRRPLFNSAARRQVGPLPTPYFHTAQKKLLAPRRSRLISLSFASASCSACRMRRPCSACAKEKNLLW
jgi:hypothetical protein